MKMLVLVDGSKSSEAILPVAAEEAKRAGYDVVLAMVFKPAGPAGEWVEQHSYSYYQSDMGTLSGTVQPRHPDEGKQSENAGQAEVAVLLSAVDYLKGMSKAAFGGKAMVLVEEGDHVAAALAGMARRERPDMIAMATHGQTGLARLALGSVAGAVLKEGIAPVLLVRPKLLH